MSSAIVRSSGYVNRRPPSLRDAKRRAVRRRRCVRSRGKSRRGGRAGRWRPGSAVSTQRRAPVQEVVEAAACHELLDDAGVRRNQARCAARNEAHGNTTLKTHRQKGAPQGRNNRQSSWGQDETQEEAKRTAEEADDVRVLEPAQHRHLALEVLQRRGALHVVQHLHRHGPPAPPPAVHASEGAAADVRLEGDLLLKVNVRRALRQTRFSRQIGPQQTQTGYCCDDS